MEMYFTVRGREPARRLDQLALLALLKMNGSFMNFLHRKNIPASPNLMHQFVVFLQFVQGHIFRVEQPLDLDEVEGLIGAPKSIKGIFIFLTW